MVWSSTSRLIGGGVLVASLVLAATWAQGSRTVAFAACTDEQGIFVRDTLSTGATGAYAHFDVRNRDLAAKNSCSYVDAVSTTQIHAVTDSTEQVETGWVERYKSDGSRKWDWFYEAQNGSTVAGGLDTGSVSISCCGNYTFKVQENSAHTVWHFYSHPGESGTFTDIGSVVPWDLVGFSQGRPIGETNRKGGACTGMADDHYGLQYENVNGWNYWNDNKVDYYQSPRANWSWEHLGPAHYDTTIDSIPAC